MRAVLLMTLILLSGCSTVLSKSEGLGETYSGVQLSMCFNSLALDLVENETFIIGVFALPFTLSDLLLSSFADTLLLPLDMLDGKPPATAWECESNT